MDIIKPHLPLDPLLIFVITLLLILTIPKLFEKIHLPGLVGLLLCGLLIGPNGLNLGSIQSGHLFSDIGKLMVMFFAGLEIDYDDFISNKYKSLIFGLSTFLMPLIAGAIIGLSFGYSLNSSLLIGSLLASHTLLAMPLLIKYGIVNLEVINVTIGATVFTDVAALILLTVCVSLHTVGFSPGILSVRLISVLIYLPVVLFDVKVTNRFLDDWINGLKQKFPKITILKK